LILVCVDDNRFLINKESRGGKFRTAQGTHFDPLSRSSQTCHYFVFDTKQSWLHLVEHTLDLLDDVFSEEESVRVIIDVGWTNAVFRKANDLLAEI
jgi:hypothetical protein